MSQAPPSPSYSPAPDDDKKCPDAPKKEPKRFRLEVQVPSECGVVMVDRDIWMMAMCHLNYLLDSSPGIRIAEKDVIRLIMMNLQINRISPQAATLYSNRTPVAFATVLTPAKQE